jgi:hypothetical protein
VTTFYDQLASAYASIREYQTEPYAEATRKELAEVLLEQIKQLCTPHKLDPKKLTALKNGIREYQDCLFVCLTKEGIQLTTTEKNEILES